MNERYGVLGGAFDPPHLGHLILAECARDQLELARVLFVPSYHPPDSHKTIATSYEHRCNMAAAALSGIEGFEVSTIESRLEPPTYTVDMLRQLRAEIAASELFFLMGADSLVQLGSWHQSEQLLQLATLAVARRSGYEGDSQYPHVMIQMPLIGISARDLRQRAQMGKSLRFLVPDTVIEYIAEWGLYRAP